ncbi:Di-copper centre-containing protein [Ramicandelaber brevisporus]|nr:Di-copper centre-containing protein [Ramicandelaber brevisporus]KAI8872105.1 Di-copper centre-containing protein [Ramicandelaber brevisporus]
MRFSLTYLAAAAAAVGTLLSSTGSFAQAQSCSSNYLRKEVREMTMSEMWNYLVALSTLKSTGQYDAFAARHAANLRNVHNHAQFLPWHRFFIWDFERLLRTVNRDIALPYWDWTKDSQDASSSLLLTGFLFGSDGNPDNNRCVDDSVFGVWKMRTSSAPCLQRKYDKSQYMWNNLNVLASMQAFPTYAEYNHGIEISAHGTAHLYLGGDMSMDWSPNDPMFWLHHAQLDRMWAIWQFGDWNNRVYQYEGPNPNGSSGDLYDFLTSYEDRQIRVGDVMALGTRDMCYLYTNMDLEAPKMAARMVQSSSASLKHLREVFGEEALNSPVAKAAIKDRAIKTNFANSGLGKMLLESAASANGGYPESTLTYAPGFEYLANVTNTNTNTNTNTRTSRAATVSKQKQGKPDTKPVTSNGHATGKTQPVPASGDRTRNTAGKIKPSPPKSKAPAKAQPISPNPIKYIQMMGMDVNEVRSVEQKLASVVAALNAKLGFSN